MVVEDRGKAPWCFWMERFWGRRRALWPCCIIYARVVWFPTMTSIMRFLFIWQATVTSVPGFYEQPRHTPENPCPPRPHGRWPYRASFASDGARMPTGMESFSSLHPSLCNVGPPCAHLCHRGLWTTCCIQIGFAMLDGFD